MKKHYPRVVGIEEHQRAVAEGKRNAILAAARALFGERGYERVSMGQVAKVANVSTATLYKHFGGKEALFEAILTARCQSFEEELTTLQLEDELEAGIVHFARAYGELLARDQTTDTLRLLVGDAPAFPDAAERFFERLRGPLQAPLRRYLRQQQRAGHAQIDDDDIAIRQLLGMIEGGVLWRRLLTSQPVDPGHVEHVCVEATRTWLARFGV